MAYESIALSTTLLIVTPKPVRCLANIKDGNRCKYPAVPDESRMEISKSHDEKIMDHLCRGHKYYLERQASIIRERYLILQASLPDPATYSIPAPMLKQEPVSLSCDAQPRQQASPQHTELSNSRLSDGRSDERGGSNKHVASIGLSSSHNHRNRSSYVNVNSDDAIVGKRHGFSGPRERKSSSVDTDSLSHFESPTQSPPKQGSAVLLFRDIIAITQGLHYTKGLQEGTGLRSRSRPMEPSIEEKRVFGLCLQMEYYLSIHDDLAALESEHSS
ncbi:MAG: hypothetical protein Q9204_001818 [Flavoplaca sp. TL-2023a]